MDKQQATPQLARMRPGLNMPRNGPNCQRAQLSPRRYRRSNVIQQAMTPKKISLTTQRKIEMGAYLLGALLVFAFNTTVELLNPEFMSLLHPIWHIGFNVIHALLVNLIIGASTKWINLGLESRFAGLSWWKSPVKRFLVQASPIFL